MVTPRNFVVSFYPKNCHQCDLLTLRGSLLSYNRFWIPHTPGQHDHYNRVSSACLMTIDKSRIFCSNEGIFPVIRKFHPRKFHPRKFHPRKFHPAKIPPSENSTQRKFHPAKIPPSENSTQRKFHPAKIPPTKIPPTKIPPTKIPPTKIPPTKIPPSENSTQRKFHPAKIRLG